MPLDENDAPRDDGFDDSYNDRQQNRNRIPVNNNQDEGYVDFDFTSDEEDDDDDDVRPINNLEIYANYQLLDQGNGPNEFHAEPQQQSSDSDNENNDNGQLFQHNAVIQWIETDEPLFNREEYEQHQRRQQERRQQSNRPDSNNDPIADFIHTSHPTTATKDNVERVIESGSKANQPSTSSSDSNSTTMNQHSESDKVNLDKDKIDTIKNLMSNFKLPTESIPEWATNDDQWKNFLDKRIKKEDKEETN